MFDTLKVIQWPSLYESYFDSLNNIENSISPREPSSQKINLIVKEIEVEKVNNTLLMFAGESLSKNKVVLSFMKFDTAKHKINYETNRIDGKIAYGHDGIYPGFFNRFSNSPWKEFEYQYLNKIEFKYNNNTYSDSLANRAFYFNCPSSDIYIKIYEIINKDIFIIWLSGGDGAGTYSSLFFYKDGKYLTDYEWQYGYQWYLTKFGKDYFNCKDKKGCIYDILFSEQKK